MDQDQYAFFQKLVETIGPSGYEQAAQQVWRDRVQGSGVDVKTDAMGNVIASLNADGRPRVMLDAHVDQIGFLVRYIDENGYIYWSPIGGFDPVTLAGNRVTIMGTGGPVLGVIGRKPIHLLEQEERKKAPQLKNLWIDIGASSKEEAEKLLGIGDAGGRESRMQRLQGSLVTAAGLDDRVGCYMVAETFRNLTAGRPSAAVFAASTVQEEIGLRGARAAAYEINPDVAVALEVTWTSDHPESSKTELGEIKVGAGPVIFRGANTNPKVFERLVAAARAAGAPYQVDALPGGTPTDENVIQTERGGVATGLMSVPTRYLHTNSELLSTDDVDAAVAILTRFVQDLGSDSDFTP
ncbi:MAG TPA: M42 family metallopeptidase [Chloroflexota bacterium]|nr:M42 family metallopeptidase [Chloroflexota bacterium]